MWQINFYISFIELLFVYNMILNVQFNGFSTFRWKELSSNEGCSIFITIPWLFRSIQNMCYYFTTKHSIPSLLSCELQHILFHLNLVLLPCTGFKICHGNGAFKDAKILGGLLYLKVLSLLFNDIIIDQRIPGISYFVLREIPLNFFLFLNNF